MQVFYFKIKFLNLKRASIGRIESFGLTALDACCACGGGTYTCNNNNLELLFYGKCNCKNGLIWSNE